MQKEDFRVFENGVEQPVLHCASTEEPLDLILLFDVSGSMRAKVEQVTEAAAQGMRELLEGDRVSVMVFDTRSRVILPFTKNLDRVEQAIRHDVLSLKFNGGTMIQAAVDDAAKRFIGQPPSERRRAVLIITDNIGQRTRRESSVVRTFWEADAILSGLIVSDKVFQAVRTVGIIMSPQNLLFQAGMKGIAEKTGGDTVNAPDPGTAFVAAMRRIRTRYSLYYAQPKGQEGNTRSIRVELSKEAAGRYPKARVRSRTGYVSPPMLTAAGN